MNKKIILSALFGLTALVACNRDNEGSNNNPSESSILLTKAEDENGDTFEYKYDGNKIVEIISNSVEDGNTKTIFTYKGNFITAQTGIGKDEKEVYTTHYTYDNQGRLATVKETEGGENHPNHPILLP